MVTSKFIAPALIALFVCVACSTGDQIIMGDLEPTLLFESGSENPDYSFTAARNMALDSDKNLYIFDYLDNTIKKYDRSGRHAVTFGGQGEGPGRFLHLMEIRVYGDQLLALDSVGTLVFSLDGTFIEKTSFQEEIICEFPRIDKDGRFAGERYSQSELNKSLTLRDPHGIEIERLAEYDLREFFPELEEGKDFFVQDYQARFYLYDFCVDGGLIWASSDACQVYSYVDGASTPLVSEDLTPLPIPEDQVAEMEKRAEFAKKNPMLHMYVPKLYQIVQHLLAAPNGDIWAYVMSAEKTGFLVFSRDGQPKGQYAVNADFDMTRVKVQMFYDVIYYFVPGRNAVKIYMALRQ
jgi:hypothetical protein